MKKFLQAIIRNQHFDIFSFRYMQSRQRNSDLIRKLTLTSAFPANSAKSVRYLDLSYNDYEIFSGGFIRAFPKLKFLDLSHNSLYTTVQALVCVFETFFFHPELQVLAMDKQFQNNIYAQYDVNTRKRRDTHYDTVLVDGSVNVTLNQIAFVI